MTNRHHNDNYFHHTSKKFRKPKSIGNYYGRQNPKTDPKLVLQAVLCNHSLDNNFMLSKLSVYDEEKNKKAISFNILKLNVLPGCERYEYKDYSLSDVEWLIGHKSFTMKISSQQLFGSLADKEKLLITNLKEMIKSDEDHIIDLYESLLEKNKK